MDSVSQAALGAVIGEVILGKKIGNKGALIGAVIGTLPDLDVILLPFFNEIQRISIHRGYSHSLIVALLMAFVLTFLLRRSKWAGKVSYFKLWLTSFLGWSTHLLLDTCTTYGTQLFLPFSNERVSWDIVSIVDPYYTAPLLIGLFLSLVIYRKKFHRSIPSYIGFGLSVLYLMLTVHLKHSAEKQFEALLHTQQIEYDHLLTTPVSFGKNDWFAVAKSSDGIYMLQHSAIQKGNSQFEYFPANDQLLDQVDPKIAEKLKWFAQDFYAVSEYEGKIRLYNLQCDMQGIRYFGDTKVPTAFYFEIDPKAPKNEQLSVGMHSKE